MTCTCLLATTNVGKEIPILVIYIILKFNAFCGSANINLYKVTSKPGWPLILEEPQEIYNILQISTSMFLQIYTVP
jgi:hypothetical protein